MADEQQNDGALSPRQRLLHLGHLVVRRIHELHEAKTANSSIAKGRLAVLRKAVYSAPGTLPELWELCAVPDELQPPFVGDEPTTAENSVHTALCLYARHEQSNRGECMHKEGVPFAQAAFVLAHASGAEETAGVRSRLNAAATAVSYQEFVRHIAGLISMLRSANIRFDYADLTRDLYQFHTPSGREAVRRRWARSYRPLPKAQETKSTTSTTQGA